MSSIAVNSPAKINLGLNVIRKRNDGYHDIETIFLPLLLCDTITFAKSNELKLKTNSDLLNNSSGNLVLKAIELLGRSTKSELKLKVFVNKVIPIGGGLGGGSSNAAITLKTVNKIYNLGLISDELFQLALELGSDVPFFLNPVTSFAESRGEILQPLKFEVPYPILIVNPGIKIDTSWAFSKIHPSKPKKSLKI
ncbi:MAG: 4-(cytidine 5'-diphospho)-2-C-methyl-D-erythritol kinase [Ignavibacteriaceae bacterium]|nr:4-(cytidine 5'-diphospho)-2-C-methyl-D-erythritol kinase [Ignavibacteriaceae bacterium]